MITIHGVPLSVHTRKAIVTAILKKIDYRFEVVIPVIPEDRIVDPTGVGDAFRGGFLAAYSHGLDWTLCGQVGSLAAVYVLEQNGTQNHHYSRQEFVERFRKHYDDGGRLDALLK